MIENPLPRSEFSNYIVPDLKVDVQKEIIDYPREVETVDKHRYSERNFFAPLSIHQVLRACISCYSNIDIVDMQCGVPISLRPVPSGGGRCSPDVFIVTKNDLYYFNPYSKSLLPLVLKAKGFKGFIKDLKSAKTFDTYFPMLFFAFSSNRLSSKYDNYLSVGYRDAGILAYRMHLWFSDNDYGSCIMGSTFTEQFSAALGTNDYIGAGGLWVGEGQG